MATQVEKAWLY